MCTGSCGTGGGGFLLGRLPTPAEYQTFMDKVDETAEDTYRYLNFDQLNEYTKVADGVIFQTPGVIVSI